MLDRYPARRIMAITAVMLCVALTALGLSQSAMFSAVALAVVLPVAVLGGGTLTLTVLLVRWFVIQRGRVMLLAALGMSGGNVVIVPLLALMITHVGWRMTLIGAGTVVMILMLLIAWLIRELPGPDEHENAAASMNASRDGGAAVAEPVLTPLSVLLRVPETWLLGIGCSLMIGMSQAVTVSLVPLALEAGATLMRATALVSTLGITSIAGKLLLAAIADRINRIWMPTGFAVGGMVLNIMLLGSTTYSLLLFSSALLGLTMAAMLPVLYAHLADRFGDDFGAVRGLMVPVTAVIGASCIRFAGDVFDWTGTYDIMFITFAIAITLGALLIWSTRFLAPRPLAMALA